jgi:hypothetical protein
MRNLKLALRTLARTPFVTAVAALSLGLGIGANSAIYSISIECPPGSPGGAPTGW